MEQRKATCLHGNCIQMTQHTSELQRVLRPIYTIKPLWHTNGLQEKVEKRYIPGS